MEAADKYSPRVLELRLQKDIGDGTRIFELIEPENGTAHGQWAVTDLENGNYHMFRVG